MVLIGLMEFHVLTRPSKTHRCSHAVNFVLVVDDGVETVRSSGMSTAIVENTSRNTFTAQATHNNAYTLSNIKPQTASPRTAIPTPAPLAKLIVSLSLHEIFPSLRYSGMEPRSRQAADTLNFMGSSV